MADIGDDEFSDDDFDALAGEQLFELEQRALQATQHPPNEPSQRPTKLINTHRLLDDKVRVPTPLQEQSSDYGDLDDDLLDTVIENPTGYNQVPSQGPYRPPNGTQGYAYRGQWGHNNPLPSRPIECTGPNPAFRPPRPVSGSQVNRPARPLAKQRLEATTDENYFSQKVVSSQQRTDSGPQVPAENLQAQLEQLRLENEALKNQVHASNDKLISKTGEISIIRANQNKVKQEHDNRLVELQRQHAREIEKQKIELEQAKKEKERIATHNKFLDHEINGHNLQQKQKAGKGKRTTVPLNSTPKKNKGALLRDGFDDNEIMIVSPTKSPHKSKVNTPKAGAKRKRDALGDSPAQPLPISQDFNDFLPDAPEPFIADTRVPPGIHSADASKEKSRFDFLQRFLNHRMEPGGVRTFEKLSTFAFPIDSTTSFASCLLDKMASLNTKSNIEDYPAEMGLMIISLWTQCLDIKIYAPLKYLIDLVKFILLNSSSTTASTLMDKAVDVAQKTADVNIISRYYKYRKDAQEIEDSDIPEPSDEIDVQECLQIIHLIATLCAKDAEDMARFWGGDVARFDFISMLLRATQELDDIIIMVKILMTSVRETGFALERTRGWDKSTVQEHLIDRITSMLIEVPRRPDSEEGYDVVEISELRQQLLCLLEEICTKQYCAAILANHNFAIGRLVRLMHDELNAVYNHQYGHEHRIEIINQSTRLVFHLSALIGDDTKLKRKLAASPGNPITVYKFLITLSRLAFSDGVFYERDIDPDVIECAQQMLEEFVNPDEVYASEKAFVKGD